MTRWFEQLKNDILTEVELDKSVARITQTFADGRSLTKDVPLIDYVAFLEWLHINKFSEI